MPPPSPSADIQNLATFLARFRAFQEQWADARLTSFVERFTAMRGALRALCELGAARDREEAPAFNLFQVLGIHRREVKTHSALLAEIWNPEGRHGQGHLFLNAFLEHLNAHQPDNPPRFPLHADGWRCGTELAALEGRMDIVLTNWRRHCLIVVENKIDADEQKEQLPRYWDWMQRQRGLYEMQQLVYLTPDGREPTEKGDLSEADYLRMSYRKNISHILRQCEPKIQSPLIQTVVRQYLQILPTL